jgi:CubicO group peptidase (beta-lactamase class C family)
MTATAPTVGYAARIDELLHRYAAGGLAVGVIRNGELEFFAGRGFADTTSKTPVTVDTVFRIGSISKTFTALAVMQLVEQGRIGLDDPVSDHLRSYQLVPASPDFPPVLIRHLLTHTAGIGELRRWGDVTKPLVGLGVRLGAPVPRLADYYAKGLRVEVPPGTKWAYANHGFATLGQIVEDVSGEAFETYLRENILDVLGMRSTDLVRSDRVRAQLATGYRLRQRGLKGVKDREIVVGPAGAIFSNTADMARYVAALLSGGSSEHGTVVRPDTLAEMFAPHYQPDPRLPGMGLAFLRADMNGRNVVGHDGGWPGFVSSMLVAPDDGVGVIAFTNTGGRAPGPVATALMRDLLDLPQDQVRADLPQHAEVWADLCGWYGPNPGPLTNLRVRGVAGAGFEVAVHKDKLVLRGMTPVPRLRHGLTLHPDDPSDPDVFRVDLSNLGLPTSRVTFSRGEDGRVDGLNLGVLPMSLVKRPDAKNPRRYAQATPALIAGAVVIRRRRRRSA